MATFYQAHVREPVFLAMTSAGLWALDDQDVGVSLASAAGSTLAIFATFLVGAELLSPWAGIIAALFVATEFELITWGVDGWRDDTFTAAILFSMWSLLRLRNRPSFGNAVAAGVFAAIACLTRITAVTFLAPALAWLVIDRADRPRRERVTASATAAVILAIIVAPYLISCTLATGDPLIAIDYHTRYYRFAENQPIDKPMSAAEYIRRKFAERPVATLDTGLNGIFVQPFFTKWNGLGPWAPGAGAAARALGAAGLAAMPFFAGGRLLLVALLGSLVPYMFTWNVGGGGEWRFTMHAYPFFFVAVGVAVVGVVRGVRAVATDPAILRSRALGIAWRAALAASVAAVGVATYFVLPWYVIRESLVRGESTSIETGERDRVFYRSGWSPLHVDNIPFRVSRTERAVVRLPLPQKRAYDIALRIDPITPTSPEQFDVLFNRSPRRAVPVVAEPGARGLVPYPRPARDRHCGQQRADPDPHVVDAVVVRRTALRLAWPVRAPGPAHVNVRVVP